MWTCGTNKLLRIGLAGLCESASTTVFFDWDGIEFHCHSLAVLPPIVVDQGL
jgi:hypothetical protein